MAREDVKITSPHRRRATGLAFEDIPKSTDKICGPWEMNLHDIYRYVLSKNMGRKMIKQGCIDLVRDLKAIQFIAVCLSNLLLQISKRTYSPREEEELIKILKVLVRSYFNITTNNHKIPSPKLSNQMSGYASEEK